ncbi:MAG TPA: hypothetical protein VLK27_11130 [Chthoniobacterales bacterium]|nr:hypothetical protein [Chthoniobacterales bacterium]
MKKLPQNPESDADRRHRRKVIGFLIAEASAIGLLLSGGAIAVLVRITDSTLAWSINILTIVAAMAVALIPIIVFGITPVIPRGR